MKGNERKRKKKAKAASSQQPASQQYIYQYKIQSIVPNTFSNKESIAKEDSLHNQLKNFISFPQLFGRGINHFPTLFSKAAKRSELSMAIYTIYVCVVSIYTYVWCPYDTIYTLISTPTTSRNHIHQICQGTGGHGFALTISEAVQILKTSTICFPISRMAK